MNELSGANLTAAGKFLVYDAEDGRIKLEVRLEGETVWLSQQQIADLFQTTQQNVSLHLRNVFKEGELQRNGTHNLPMASGTEAFSQTAISAFQFKRQDACLQNFI